MREFKEWYRNPSPDTLKAFRLKQEEESHLRLVTAAPFRYCSTAAGLPVVPTPPEAERVKMIHRPDLRDSEFGVILSAEQIDVRHVLLADPPFAPLREPAFLCKLEVIFNLIFLLLKTEN